MIHLKRTNTILYCRHWLETVSFYTEKLELPVTFRSDWFVEFRLGDAAFLSVADATRATIQAVEGQGITLAWEVDDVERTREQLKTAGIFSTPLRPRWNARVCYCRDPEGHRIEFYQMESPDPRGR